MPTFRWVVVHGAVYDGRAMSQRPELLRRLLVNRYEEYTHTALEQAVGNEGGRVSPKVRLADIVNLDAIRDSHGLTSSEFHSALQMSFDFLVTDHDSAPLFAVEFDGPQHHDPDVARRDRLKNRLCEQAGLQLLRIESDYLEPVGRFPTMVQWLAELRLLEVKFDQAQAEGQIPLDEPFTTLTIWGKGGPTHDPFLRSWEKLRMWRSEGRVGPCYGGSVGLRNGKERAVVVIAVPPFVGDQSQMCVVGSGGCTFPYFGGVFGFEFAGDLAVLDALDKAERHAIGKCPAVADSTLGPLKAALDGHSGFGTS